MGCVESRYPIDRKSGDKRSYRGRKRGFALILSLALMTFLVLLVLSLSTVSQIEIRAAATKKKRFLARQHALLGLRIALGELQEHAGPDQRVTAIADPLTGRHERRRFWTGVWDAEDQRAGPEWLVSGFQPDFLQAPSQVRSVRLVGSNTVTAEEDFVEAEGVEIPAGISGGSESTPIGYYAYWVGDEGLKASVVSFDKTLDAGGDWLASFSSTERARLRQLSGQRFSPHLALTAVGRPPYDPDFESSREEMRKVTTREDLPFISKVFDREKLKRYFHHLTPRALGLLVSPKTGMKRDFSAEPGAAGSAGLQSYLNFEEYTIRPENETDSDFSGSSESLRRRHAMRAPSTDVPGEICHSVAPVLTDFYMLFTVTRGSGSAIVVRYRLHTELWNPYSSALVPEDLLLEVRGLPIVALETEDGQTREVDLQRTLNNESGDGDPLVLLLPFRDNPAWPGEDDRSWLPGRVYSWIAPNNASGRVPKTTDGRTAQFYSRTMHNGIWETVVPAVSYPPPLSQRFKIVSPASTDLHVVLRRTARQGGEVLVTFEGYTFDNFETTFYRSTQRPLQFGYRFRLFEPGDLNLASSGWAKSLWLRNNDPRDPHPTFGAIADGHAYFPPNGFSPDSYTVVQVKQPPWLFDRTQGRTGKNFMEDVPLFELPRQPQISMGALQHLHIVGATPFSIGNSWGLSGRGDFNLLFDRFFFSGLADPSLPSGLGSRKPLPNTRLLVFRSNEDDRSEEASPAGLVGETGSRYLINGAFNVNSTSSVAWESLLGGIQLPGWEFIDLDESLGAPHLEDGEPKTLRTDLNGAFFRFSHSAQETYETGPHTSFDADQEPSTEYYRVGVRPLLDDSGVVEDSKLRQLAVAVARNVKTRIARAGPYRSLSEFLGPDPSFPHPEDSNRFSNALEAAIASVPAINTIAGEEIHHLASSSLTSADLMTALAPVAAVRSDTFLIRSFGDSINPVTGVAEGRAWCQAVVQRLPTLVSDEDSVILTASDGPGRRFEIVEFRWLDSSDI